MAANEDDAKIPPRNVIMRKVGITARIKPLLAAWNSLNFENLFMISAYNSLTHKKSPTITKNDITCSGKLLILLAKMFIALEADILAPGSTHDAYTLSLYYSPDGKHLPFCLGCG